MKTLTYTYDETSPTNKDYIICALTGEIDDGGASYDAVAEYNIDCPYYSSVECLNAESDNEYGTAAYKETCLPCKLKWLERTYDT